MYGSVAGEVTEDLGEDSFAWHFPADARCLRMGWDRPRRRAHVGRAGSRNARRGRAR